MKRALIFLITCMIIATVVAAEPAIRIGRPIITSPGALVDVDIFFDNSSGMEIGGFDLYMTYDSSLNFQTAVTGQLLIDCEWEYFTYRTEALNQLRLVAMADINNGAAHPLCYAGTSGTLARLTFVVDVDPNIDIDFLTIRYLWYDCGDNTLSSVYGDTLFISHDVYAFNGVYDYLITKDTAFPTPYGAPDECLPNVRGIDFYNGGVYAVINDTVPPTAICPEDIIKDIDPGQCGAVATFTANVSDNSPGATITCNPPSGSFFPAGETTVTCVAIDLFDNADTCNFTLTVNDAEPPLAICPEDIIVISVSDSCGALAPYVATVTDNCPGASISCFPPPTAFFPVGATPVTCIAFDAAGNADTCAFNITVVDSEPPVLECPEDLVFPNDINYCGAAVTYEVTASDNCAIDAITCDPPSGSYFATGETQVTCIASDALGNADSADFKVTVTDIEPPVADCPDDITVPNDSGECGARVSFSASVSDNCDGAVINCDPPSGALFPARSLPVICIGVDAAGNADTTGFTLTVIDTQAPVIEVPPIISTTIDPGQCGATVTFDPVVIDNCANADILCNPPSGSFFEVGITSVTCIGSDDWDNADTVSFAVVVADTSFPILDCPSDIEVQNDSGAYGAIVNYTATATDNCPEINIAILPPSGSFFEIGTTSVEVTATDNVGNVDVCQFDVTVILNDPDKDGVATWDDNCPDSYNPDQTDTDGDGLGDICDWRYGDANGDDEFNVGDAVFLISYVFSGGPAPQPIEAGDANCDGQANVADAVFLINFVFGNGPPPNCP